MRSKFNLAGAIQGVVIFVIMVIVALAFYGLATLLDSEILPLVLYLSGSGLVASFIFGSAIFTKD